MKTCIVCAGTLSGRQQRFCSRPCSIKGYTATRVASGRAATCQAGQRKRPEYAPAQRRRAQEWRQVNRHMGICAQCGDPFECAADHPEQTYCSKSCAGVTKGQMQWPKRRLAAMRLAKAARGTRAIGRRLVSGPCARCGAQFTALQTGNDPATYCSRRCKRSDKGARRRARKHGVRLTPGRRYDVFVRDGWICQICGDPVNRGAVFPDLDCAVVDHRVALARGGEHGPGNWQTAHNYCNSVKRETDLCLIAA